VSSRRPKRRRDYWPGLLSGRLERPVEGWWTLTVHGPVAGEYWARIPAAARFPRADF